MTNIAFKEWAAVCHLLRTGRQVLILRKGGIHEQAGQFRPEHGRFWLYPTRFHETQQAGLKPEARAIYDAWPMKPYGLPPEYEMPADGVALESIAEVHAVYHLNTLDAALALDEFHGWTPETVTQRFYYRKPGLFALVVRVSAIPGPWTFPETPAYAGCKTWVTLDDGVVPDHIEARAVRVQSEAAFEEVAGRIEVAASRE